MATNFMVGRSTASAIASASRKSFFCPFEYGRTYRRHQPRIVAERLELPTQVMRPEARLRADEATRHVGEPSVDLLRDNFWRRTMAPILSRPMRWNVVLPMSIPIVGTA
jgi:hypothetical protein